jgi:protein-disulfide isomerase
VSADVAPIPPVTERDHVLGPADAPVTLVTYANYECLHCRRAHPFLEALRAEAGDRLRYVYRHFARPADFPNAEPAARAAEAAALQGRFWQMQHALYTGDPRLRLSDLLRHAQDIGLDLSRFEHDLPTPPLLARVRADLAGGIAAGVRGTPTFFINGRLHETAWDLESVRRAVLDEISGRPTPGRPELSAADSRG